MVRLARSSTLALFAAALCVPLAGTAQQAPRNPAPPIPPAQVTATLKRQADIRIAAFNAEKQRNRTATAQQVRTAASQLAARLAARVPRIRIDTMVPVIDTVVTPAGGVEPNQIFSVLGSKLSTSGVRTEVHVLLGGKDLVGIFLGGGTPQKQETYLPDFDGIAAPTLAQLYVKTGDGRSEPVPILLKPELVQLHLDIQALKSTLTAESHGTNLSYLDPCMGPNCYEIHDMTTIGGFHNAAYKSPPASGTDYFFTSFKLKNNWVVRELTWYNPVSNGAPGQTSAKATAALGTSALAATVNWWHNESSANQAIYYLGYVIEGPKGVPFK